MEYNYETALKDLQSHLIRDRINAVKFFIKHKDPEMKKMLIMCKRTEKVEHIKKLLTRAINNLEEMEVIKEIDEKSFFSSSEDEEKINRYIKAKAIDEFSGVILHELARNIGLLKINAQREVNSYETSKTKNSIETFERIFYALESLRKSSAPPEISEINLYQLIIDIVSQETDSSIKVTYEGSQPFIIKTDKNLLYLAISNGIRNAKESLLELEADNPKFLTLKWGKTDVDTWICIEDEGIGLSDDPENMFRIGATSKTKHTGFGLGIIKQAMESLGGDATLKNNEVGAQLMLKWES
ncbi:MAG: HAMP domain-containing histidine kinase [Campylobacteraceae bacterium]|nr:HAMP domain-containing histidine kinase [Campylobacteraceae bacterium]